MNCQGNIQFGLILNTVGRTKFPPFDRSEFFRKEPCALNRYLGDIFDQYNDVEMSDEYGRIELIAVVSEVENDYLRVCSKYTFTKGVCDGAICLFEQYVEEVMLRVNRILYVHHVAFPEGMIRYKGNFLIPLKKKKWLEQLKWYDLKAVEPVLLESTVRILSGEEQNDLR